VGEGFSMTEWFTCNVNMAGVAVDASEGPNPVTYINLTDRGGRFTDYWFYAAEVAKKEMLATSLTAMSTRSPISVAADPPNPNNNPYTQIYRLYMRVE
jgi:hypothetical protein